MTMLTTKSLSLNQKGADALRVFADALLTVEGNITTETESLIERYKLVSDQLGVHRNQFLQILLHVQKAQLLLQEPLENISKMMYVTADAIEMYMRTNIANDAISVRSGVRYFQKPRLKNCEHTVLGQFGENSVGKHSNVIGNPAAAALYEKLYDRYLSGKVREEIYRQEDQFVQYIDPNYIEGIHVDRGKPDCLRRNPSSESRTYFDEVSFWNTGKRSGKRRYLELASHIPEINRQLKGLSVHQMTEKIKQLENDEVLGACATLYFAEGIGRMIQAVDAGGIMVFSGDGRHRILAAREVMEKAKCEAEAAGRTFDERDYYIPTLVAGKWEYSGESGI